MNTTTDRSTLIQSKMMRGALGAVTPGMRPGTDAKSAAVAFEGYDDIASSREALEATDEDTTNPYDESLEDKQSRLESSSSTTIVSGIISGSHSETDPLADAAAAEITRVKRRLSDAAVSSVEGNKRPTFLYQETRSFLKVTTPSRNAAAHQKGSATSANTSAAFPEDVSKVVELSTPTPPRSNFVGGPGGPHRSGPLGAAAHTPGSPPPSVPQTANTGAFNAFSESYEISKSTAANAPSFAVAYPPSIKTGAGSAAAYTPRQALGQTLPSGPSVRSVGPGAALVTASIVASVGPSWQTNDNEEHARQKRPWTAAANVDGNQPRRNLRIRIQDEAVVENEARPEEEDEGTHETYTGSSYSDEQNSYSYSYSEDEGDYEYYEEFYEEEVEEDEEDEEEPHIDMIEGDHHGHTLHDILYGTPKAGGNASRSYSRDQRESMRSDDPFLTGSKGNREPRHVGHVHLRHSGERMRSRSASIDSSEAADEAAAAHRRSTTPERVNQHHFHRQKPAKTHERAGSEDGESGHRAAAAAGKKHKKRDYEHGEPYTEGTFKNTNKKSKKASGHYGAEEDLDEMEMHKTDSDLEGSEVSHEPITSAARAGKGNRAASYSSSFSDTIDVDDNFTARSGSRPHHRERRLSPKEAKDRHRHRRSGAVGAEEAEEARKLAAKDGGKGTKEEDPIGMPSPQKRSGASYTASEKAVGAAGHDGKGSSSKKDVKREDAKAKKGGSLLSEDGHSSKKDDGDAKDKDKDKAGLLIKCACCSKENASDAMDKKAKDEEENGNLRSEDNRDAKDKKKSCLMVKCACCSKENASDAMDKKAKDEEENGNLRSEDNRDAKDKKKSCLMVKCACCSKENNAKAQDKKKSCLMVKCACCSNENASDAMDKKAEDEEENGNLRSEGDRDAKDKKKSCLMVKCACCSNENASDAMDKKAKDEEENGNLRSEGDRDAKDKKKSCLMVKCACCSKENNAKAQDKKKSCLTIKCACCSKENAKDKKQKDKGGICSRLRSFFCICGCKKRTKAQVADKKGKHDGKRKETDITSTRKEEGADSHEISPATIHSTSPKRRRSTSPAKNPVNHQFSSRQTNRVHHKTDETPEASKSQRAKQQKEAKRDAAGTPEPASPASSASMRKESEERTEDEVSVSVSEQAAHQPTSRPMSRSTAQVRRPHRRAESTEAQRGIGSQPADHSGARGKPEAVSVATPSDMSDMGENNEPGASKSPQAQQQQQRRRHRETRVSKKPRRRSRTSHRRRENESSRRRSEAK
ncbi:hypothetical protein CUR178_05887 [Leishmania enriettii]|uniref:Uncharacterized protein n=1 Tax=Leishmania enriettii TaxID=5663 RepID=A0A836H740_LEIEN|nr:hypothetical protein CUR178_05887 [Leishmania enriettii]